MAQKKRRTNEWIVLDDKLQSNSGELVEMAKTIQGITIERKGDKIWVKFPIKKTQVRKSVVHYIKLGSKSSPHNMHKEPKENNDSHYCAIMVK